MSRSYKKTPIVKDGRSGKEDKKLANRKVRRYKKGLPNGKGYRKVFNSWDIYDYVYYYSYHSLIKNNESRQKHYINGVTDRPYVFKESDWVRIYRRK